MKKIIPFLLFTFCLVRVEAQLNHYVLQEIQVNIPGEKQNVIEFYGKNIKVLLDLDRMVLSIPELKDYTYNLRNLTLFEENSKKLIYKGLSSQNGGHDWGYIHIIDKEGNFNFFNIASLRDKGVSISFLCIYQTRR